MESKFQISLARFYQTAEKVPKLSCRAKRLALFLKSKSLASWLRSWITDFLAGQVSQLQSGVKACPDVI